MIQQIGHERVLIGCPINGGAMARDHDYHVQSRGAFNQNQRTNQTINSPSNHLKPRNTERCVSLLSEIYRLSLFALWGSNLRLCQAKLRYGVLSHC